jgi:hypothetical protein
MLGIVCHSSGGTKHASRNRCQGSGDSGATVKGLGVASIEPSGRGADEAR